MVQPSMNVPVGERPDMPEGYLGAAPLPWRWAEEQLSEAHNYWVTTIGPSGRPHVRPVWGVWLDNAVQFSTGARHASNIGRDPRVTVNLEDADDCVIVEGTARAVDDEDVRRSFIEVYQPKYDWAMTLDFVDVVYVVRPSVVFGWLAHEIAQESTLFAATATKWRFDT
jgi:nitroimidazol reductase NimA-like FMN-containing flavoprotein (pyridoxamine 5'-phosphate oxidase superfamily)